MVNWECAYWVKSNLKKKNQVYPDFFAVVEFFFAMECYNVLKSGSLTEPGRGYKAVEAGLPSTIPWFFAE